MLFSFLFLAIHLQYFLNFGVLEIPVSKLYLLQNRDFSTLVPRSGSESSFPFIFLQFDVARR